MSRFYLFDGDSPEDELTGWSVRPPALAVEVLSENDDVTKTLAKIGHYLKNGITVVCLVHCEARTATLFRPDTPEILLRGDQEITDGDALPGFSCKVADLFMLPGDRPPPPAPPQAAEEPQPPTS